MPSEQPRFVSSHEEFPPDPELDSELDRRDAFNSHHIQKWVDIFQSWQYTAEADEKYKKIEQQLISALAAQTPPELRAAVPHRRSLVAGLPLRILRLMHQEHGQAELNEQVADLIVLFQEVQSTVDTDQQKWDAGSRPEKNARFAEERRHILRRQHQAKNKQSV